MEEVSSVFKKYLRELPEPIFTDGTADNVLQMEVKQLVESRNEAMIIAGLPSLIAKLTFFRRSLLKEVFFLLHLVYLKSEKNLMSPDNIATIFGGMLHILSTVMMPYEKCLLCKILTKEYATVFADFDVFPVKSSENALPLLAPVSVYIDNGTWKSIALSPGDKAHTVSRIMRQKLLTTHQINATTFRLYELYDRKIRLVEDQEDVDALFQLGAFLVFSGFFNPDELKLSLAEKLQKISLIGEKIETPKVRPQRPANVRGIHYDVEDIVGFSPNHEGPVTRESNFPKSEKKTESGTDFLESEFFSGSTDLYVCSFCSDSYRSLLDYTNPIQSESPLDLKFEHPASEPVITSLVSPRYGREWPPKRVPESSSVKPTSSEERESAKKEESPSQVKEEENTRVDLMRRSAAASKEETKGDNVKEEHHSQVKEENEKEITPQETTKRAAPPGRPQLPPGRRTGDFLNPPKQPSTGEVIFFGGEQREIGHKPSICFLDSNIILQVHKSVHRAALHQCLGKCEVGNHEGKGWKITWNPPKALDSGDVPVVAYNGSGLILQCYRSSPSPVLWYSLGKHVPDPTGTTLGDIEWGPHKKWGTGDSPSVCFKGNKVIGAFVKDRKLRIKCGLVADNSSKIDWLEILCPFPDIEGIFHPSVAFNDSGMLCVLYEQAVSSQLMCLAGNVSFCENAVDLIFGSPAIVNLSGAYPKAVITSEGIVLASFHTPSQVLCNRVGRWADRASIGLSVSWKPFVERSNNVGSGQKLSVAITQNTNPNLNTPYIVALAYQGAVDKSSLCSKIGYYTLPCQ
eukprot:TRINITY_DN7315_c0_g1_i1.p1 TRINITY_DN7315_c0_g1~~TRINITY_DN7315_c0_g1_i1.p1  ORF type:complete len:917 (+),score=145.28 TRINITY_DN7315_c0_g1_i1:352-2751(+)